MSAFQFTRKKLRSFEPHGGAEYEIQADGLYLCQHIHWVLGSCGVDSFQNFRYGAPSTFGNSEFVEEFKTFLKKTPCDIDEWLPNEYIFCLSSTQLSAGKFQALVDASKQIDTFDNRAHGPATLFIYRLSV